MVQREERIWVGIRMDRPIQISQQSVSSTLGLRVVIQTDCMLGFARTEGSRVLCQLGIT
jgi:hypothetical protein